MKTMEPSSPMDRKMAIEVMMQFTAVQRPALANFQKGNSILYWIKGFVTSPWTCSKSQNDRFIIFSHSLSAFHALQGCDFWNSPFMTFWENTRNFLRTTRRPLSCAENLATLVSLEMKLLIKQIYMAWTFLSQKWACTTRITNYL